jgi:hypothetical protein
METPQDNTNIQMSKSLDEREILADGLYKIKNFLSDTDLSILQDFLNTTDKWGLYRAGGIQKNRFVIYPSDNEWLLNTLTEKFIKLTPHVKHIFRKPRLYFGGITMWQDRQKYYIQKHTDNPIIEIAIQIYLTDNEPRLPTTFIVDDKDIIPDYKVNAGYIMDNSKQILHYMWPPIPQGQIRNSLYAFWKLTQE